MTSKGNGATKERPRPATWGAALVNCIRLWRKALRLLARASENLTVLERYTRLPKRDILDAARIIGGRSFQTPQAVMATWRKNIVCHGPAAVKNRITLILQLREILGLLDDDQLP